MRSVTQSTVGDPSVLEIVEVERPEPGYGQVLIKLGAAGINPVDAAVRSGAYPILGEPPFTLGWDVAGTIEAVGSGISAFAPGDEVLGMPAFPAEAAAHADYVLVSPNEIVRRPAALTVEEAGALPLAGLTAWQALVGIARVEAGQSVLIHRAAGGVGHLAVQIAKARGAYVIGTARADNHAFLRDLGADRLIDYTTADFVAEAGPVDVVFDLMGGEYGERSAAALKPGGLLVGALGGPMGASPRSGRPSWGAAGGGVRAPLRGGPGAAGRAGGGRAAGARGPEPAAGRGRQGARARLGRPHEGKIVLVP
nr:NADP-dependent oxidoreductase [Planobispora longispora]